MQINRCRDNGLLCCDSLLTKGQLTPMQCGAMHRIADTSEIRQGMQHDVTQHIATEVSCFKLDWVVSLALLCEEAENEEYEVRNKRKRFWVHEINLTRNVNGDFSTLFEYLLRDERKFKHYFRMSIA